MLEKLQQEIQAKKEALLASFAREMPLMQPLANVGQNVNDAGDDHDGVQQLIQNMDEKNFASFFQGLNDIATSPDVRKAVDEKVGPISTPEAEQRKQPLTMARDNNSDTSPSQNGQY